MADAGAQAAHRHAWQAALHDNQVVHTLGSDQSEDVQLGVHQTMVEIARPATGEGGDNYNIDLPPVGASKGMMFVFYMTDPDSGNRSVTIRDPDDALNSQISEALAAVNHYIVIENVGGVVWIERAKSN